MCLRSLLGDTVVKVILNKCCFLLTALCDILYYTQHMAEHDREGWQRTIENITATSGSTSAVDTLFFAPITR
jgi:hypothetical protein